VSKLGDELGQRFAAGEHGAAGQPGQRFGFCL